MRTVKSISEIKKVIAQARRKNKKIGFVPTMGALHEGHRSLLRTCRKENDISVLSIFVNPKQFGKNEDYSSYPRDLKKDELLAKKEKVDIIFYPSEETMYPDGHKTYVEVTGLDEQLCGALRPGHFRGVATVVAKLMNIVSPDTMYLGQKDAQQAVIIARMAQDLNFSTQIRILPTVREENGLAMSSRNDYLTAKERQEAGVLYRALTEAKRKILNGERRAAAVTALMRNLITQQGFTRIDYLECVDAQNLTLLTTLKGKILIALAVWVGRARLIDNISLQVK